MSISPLSSTQYFPKSCIEFKNRFAEFIANSGYELVIEHGQRIVRPQASTLFASHAVFEELFNHEIYIRNMVTDIFEAELLCYFKPIGRVYQIRFLLTFSGRTNGSAYVIFEKTQNAIDCIAMLHGQRLTPNQIDPLKVEWSANNNQLLLSNLPAKMSNDQVVNHLKASGIHGIKGASVKTIEMTNVTNAIVMFYNHRSACIARRSLVPGLVKFDDRAVQCEWFKPKDTKTLFFRFNRAMTETTIRAHFARFDLPLTKVDVQNNFVFIRFVTCQQAIQILKRFKAEPALSAFGSGIQLVKVDWPNRKGYQASPA